LSRFCEVNVINHAILSYILTVLCVTGCISASLTGDILDIHVLPTLSTHVQQHAGVCWRLWSLHVCEVGESGLFMFVRWVKGNCTFVHITTFIMYIMKELFWYID